MTTPHEKTASRTSRTAGALSRLRRPAALGAASAAVAAALVGFAGPAHAADTGVPVLEEIKQCESGGDYTAHNPFSTASGAYQFLDMVWQSTDAGAGYASAADAPEEVQDAAAVELYQEWGTYPWLPSVHCWG